MLLAFLSILFFVNTQGKEINVSVKTAQGVVIGSQALDGSHYTFFGIPYAGPTSGGNRFKAPSPPPLFEKEFDASDSKVVCAQPTTTPEGMIGEEDCLVLHVFTQDVSKSRPVVVVLEGEGYASTRERNFFFNELVQGALVVVYVNYRLSIFGFLCLGVPEAPGNAGLKDVIQALQWIQQNIAAFGGDPNNVVLLGHGSGAAMADLITLSPLSQNLVHKVIALSGSALSPWAVAYEPVQYAEKLAEKLSLAGKSRSDLAKALVSTDTYTLISVIEEFEFYNNNPLFAPCIEDPNMKNRVLLDAPINILQTGNYNQVPYIAAFVDREGTLKESFTHWLEKMNANFIDFLPPDLKFNSTENELAVAKNIREFYFGQKAISMETFDEFLVYEGDILVVTSLLRGLNERAISSKASVMLLELTFRKKDTSVNGAKHGALLNYLVSTDFHPNEVALQKSIIGRFAAFAKTGDPNPTNAVDTIKWNLYTPSSRVALRISGNDSVSTEKGFQEEAIENIHREKMDFWNNLYDQYYFPPQPLTSSAQNLFSLSLTLISSQAFLKLF